ncbi:hypothetical protein D3C84_441480 [compost metagenome]
MKLQSPRPSTGTRKISTPLSKMIRVVFGSAVPLKVGVLSSVVSPSRIGPTTAPTLSSSKLASAAAGGVVSTVIG